MDQRAHANQTGGTGHDYFIWWFCIYGTAIYRIYDPAWMDAGLLRICELLCGCKFYFIRVGLPAAAKKRCCPFFNFVMAVWFGTDIGVTNSCLVAPKNYESGFFALRDRKINP